MTFIDVKTVSAKKKIQFEAILCQFKTKIHRLKAFLQGLTLSSSECLRI